MGNLTRRNPSLRNLSASLLGTALSRLEPLEHEASSPPTTAELAQHIGDLFEALDHERLDRRRAGSASDERVDAFEQRLARLESALRDDAALRDQITYLNAHAEMQESELHALRAQVAEQHSLIATLEASVAAAKSAPGNGQVTTRQLAEELALLKRSRDEACLQLLNARRERDQLAQQLRAREGDRAPVASLAARRAPKEKPAESAPRGAVSVAHFEEHVAVQDIVAATLRRLIDVEYATAEVPIDRKGGATPVCVVNLLAPTIAPFRATSDAALWGFDAPRAVTYCAEDGRGFVLGMVDFFPHPFDTDACATRLVAREPHGLQRLLAVSEDVETMSDLRKTLGGLNCSVSSAIDARQALHLAPIVKPDVVLVDLSLPKDGALKLLYQLRTDPALAAIGIGAWWGRPPISSAELREGALRVIRDAAFDGASLATVLLDTVGRVHRAAEPAPAPTPAVRLVR